MGINIGYLLGSLNKLKKRNSKNNVMIQLIDDTRLQILDLIKKNIPESIIEYENAKEIKIIIDKNRAVELGTLLEIRDILISNFSNKGAYINFESTLITGIDIKNFGTLVSLYDSEINYGSRVNAFKYLLIDIKKLSFEGSTMYHLCDFLLNGDDLDLAIEKVLKIFGKDNYYEKIPLNINRFLNLFNEKVVKLLEKQGHSKIIN